MNYSLLKLLFVMLCIFMAACSQPSDRANPVGRSFISFVDSERRAWVGTENRPLRTTVWYPAVAEAREREWRIGVFRAGWTAPDADMVDSLEQLPLIILSHGTGGAAAQLSWLAETLAANGYLVAAVNHHGNTAAEEVYLPQGFMLWWERARDVSTVIDHLLTDSQFGHRIDSSRIGTAGFSLGGYTVLATAGALTNRDQWQLYCADRPTDPSCNLPPEAPFSMTDIERLIEEDESIKAAIERSSESYQDARIRAVYAIAPVLGPAFDAQSLADISIPVRIVVGDKDNQALPEVNAIPIAEAIPNADLLRLPDVAHYTFLAPCNFRGRFLLRQLCNDPRGVNRREIHQRVSADALAYFNQTLLGVDSPSGSF